jgi:hypothetical protein
MSSLVNTVKVAVLSVVTFPHGAIKTLFAHTPSDCELPLVARSPQHPFPQEIIDIIVGHLHDNKAVLAACSLASSSFRRPCQAMLFREIILQQRTRRIRRLCRLITHNPRLATYVRVLELNVFGSGHCKVLRCKALRTVLRKLSQLRSLSLKFTYELSWSKRIPKSLQCVLSELFRSPNLSKLMLSGLQDFPISLLHCDRQLKELHLRDVFPPLNNTTPKYTRTWCFFSRIDTSPPALVRVQSLYLEFLVPNAFPTNEALAHVRRSISLPQLHHLHINELDTTLAVDECYKLLEQCPEPVKPFDFCMFSRRASNYCVVEFNYRCYCEIDKLNQT